MQYTLYTKIKDYNPAKLHSYPMLQENCMDSFKCSINKGKNRKRIYVLLKFPYNLMNINNNLTSNR